MTVCELCKGTGKLLKPWYDTTGLMTGFAGDICFMCDGKGTIGEPMTNKEWLRKANKEEVEHTLTMLIMKDRFFADKEFAYVNIRFGVHCWLKEIHK